MKRCLSVIISLILTASLTLSSCENKSSSTKPSDKNETPAAVFYDYEFIGSWYYEDFRCTNSLTLADNGEFYYNCACGEPIADYDLYDSFRYNEKKNEIVLRGEGKRKLKLLDNDANHLLMQIDGSIINFTPEKFLPETAFFTENDNAVNVEGYSGFYSVSQGLDGKLALSLVKRKALALESTQIPSYSYELSDKLQVKAIDVTTKLGENGISDYDYSCSDTTLSAAQADGYETAFVWLNRNIKIEKITFFRETVK